MTTVGERLKEERLLRGWSQRDLAREAGTTAETVSSIETGQHEPRPSTLRKLAEGLGIEVRDFFREPALPKAEAPRGAGHSRAERLEDLRYCKETLAEIANKYRYEFETLGGRGSEDLDSLITLFVQTGWTYDGAFEFIDNDEDMKQAERGSPAERQAAKRVDDALQEILDVHEEISAVLDPLLEPDEEENRVVTRIEDYRQKRKVG